MGEDINYMDYFSMPWRRLPDLVPDYDDRSRFLPYHAEKNHIQCEELDEWGVGSQGYAQFHAYDADVLPSAGCGVFGCIGAVSPAYLLKGKESGPEGIWQTPSMPADWHQ